MTSFDQFQKSKLRTYQIASEDIEKQLANCAAMPHYDFQRSGSHTTMSLYDHARWAQLP